MLGLPPVVLTGKYFCEFPTHSGQAKFIEVHLRDVRIIKNSFSNDLLNGKRRRPEKVKF
jgi:hypothetical protein